MTCRRLSDILLRLLSVGMLVLFVRNKILDFRDFQAANPHASGWDFLLTEAPGVLAAVVMLIVVLLVAMWFEKNVPPVDADKTEFHEEGVR